MPFWRLVVPRFDDFVKTEYIMFRKKLLLWWQISTLPPVHRAVRLSHWFGSGLLIDSSWDVDCNDHFEYAFPEGQGRHQEMCPLTYIDFTYCAVCWFITNPTWNNSKWKLSLHLGQSSSPDQIQGAALYRPTITNSECLQR